MASYKYTQERPNSESEERDQKTKTVKEWRSLGKHGSWDENYTEELLEHIQKHNIQSETGKNIRILLIGPTMSGKSSFVNTVASIDSERLCNVTVFWYHKLYRAPNPPPVAQTFRPKIRLKNFELLDTVPLHECRLNIKDILYVVNGDVRPDYEFNPANLVDGESDENPQNKERVHCVVFVMDARMTGQHFETIKLVNDLQDKLMITGVPRMVLLTKIDKLCKRIDTDITYCYKSEALMKAVYEAAELFRVPESYVFPVQNYTDELEMNPKGDILTLLALRHMIHIGTDFLHSIELSDDKEDEDENNLPKIEEADTQDLVDFINFHEFKGIFF